MEIILEKNWNKTERIFTIGHFFYQSKLFNSQSMLLILANLKKKVDLLSFLSEIQGFFSFIIIFEEEVVVVSDRVRSIPFFWTRYHNDEYIFSDSPYNLINKDTKINKVSENELRLSGYVTGSETLYSNVYQTLPGFVYSYQNGKDVEISQYSTYPINNKKKLLEKKIIIQKLEESYSFAIEKMILYLDGRQAVIPLSGGLDSRFLLALLKEKSYENILTFTYGREEKDEVAISKTLASFFGVRWFFVPYENSLMQSLFEKSFDQMIKKCSLGFSSPVVQDWYAIYFLKLNGLLNPDAVIIPGHAVTNIIELSSPKIFQNKKFKKNEILIILGESNYVYNKKYKKRFENEISNKIALNLNLFKNVYNQNEASEIVFNFSYLERQSKFISNSVRIYEFEGYDWYLPFWDKSLIEIWSQIPLIYSQNREIYSTLINHMFPEMQEKIEIFGLKKRQIMETKRKKEIIKKQFPTLFKFLYSLKRKRYHNLNLDGYINIFKFIISLLQKRYSYVEMWCEKYIEKEKKNLLNEF